MAAGVAPAPRPRAQPPGPALPQPRPGPSSDFGRGIRARRGDLALVDCGARRLPGGPDRPRQRLRIRRRPGRVRPRLPLRVQGMRTLPAYQSTGPPRGPVRRQGEDSLRPRSPVPPAAAGGPAAMSALGTARGAPDAMLVSADWVPARDGRTFAVANPATGEVLAHLPEAGAADVEAAVESAAMAFPAWSRTDAAERGRILCWFADLLQQHGGETAQVETGDKRRPIP